MTRPATQVRPAKPSKNFPLTAHPCGQWVKKIGGKRYYFGVWADTDGALEKYKRDFPYLNLGLEPPVEGMVLRDVLNAFNDDKIALKEAHRISERTYNEYISVCEVIADTLGRTRPVEAIAPLDLKRLNHRLGIGKGGKPISPIGHKKYLTFARMVFRFANEILDTNIKYRQALKPPEKRLIRERKAAAGEKMFTAAEIRSLIAKANPHMKAVIYLGINCGFGPLDSISLTANRIRDGFIGYPRPKTGVQRRCPLWPETKAAIEAVKNGDHVLNGQVWNRHIIAHQFKELCEVCGIYRAGITAPYSLRRTFETVAKNADVNQSVIDRIMGHERPDMSEVYNQRTFDKQLVRCTDFVKRWLDGKIKL
jgi:integrase